MKKSERDALLDAVYHLEQLGRYADRDDRDDQLVLDAIAMRLSAAIESLSQISDELRATVFAEREWRSIKSTRNRIAHGYRLVDPELLQDIVEYNIPAFEASIRQLLEQTPE